MSFDPSQVLGQVEAGANEIEKVSDDLATAIEAAADSELNYEGALAVELIRIKNDAARAGERVPAEDLRKAIAHKAICEQPEGELLYANYLRDKAKAAALDKKLKGVLAATSARQSLLRAMGSV